MKTYVYGYDIRAIDFEKELRTIGKHDRHTVIAHELMTDEQITDRILRKICTASACRNTEPLKDRIAETRKMFEITNIKIVREYGK